jgi:NAD(P)-dependent dehydrogenase (short-subunit alcohol dehydrogenase family)
MDSPKIVLITGCSKGIGLGLVQASLAEANTFVIATCRSPASSNELRSLTQEYGRDKLLILPLDTTCLDSYKAACKSMEMEGIMSIDVLIANAGIIGDKRPDPILTCSPENMMDCFKTNCVGTMLTLQTFTPFLEKGSIKLCVLLSSRLGSITYCPQSGGLTSYRASKAAMNMLAMTYAGLYLLLFIC